MTNRRLSGQTISGQAWLLVMVGVAVAVSAANIVDMSVRTYPAPIDPSGVASDPVMRHQQRFAVLRAGAMARGLHGTLGFLSELPPGQWQADSISVEDYYLAQYALAPIILDTEAVRHEWIVADVPRAELAMRIPLGWNVVGDFGDGVVLLRKVSR